MEGVAEERRITEVFVLYMNICVQRLQVIMLNCFMDYLENTLSQGTKQKPDHQTSWSLIRFCSDPNKHKSNTQTGSPGENDLTFHLNTPDIIRNTDEDIKLIILLYFSVRQDFSLQWSVFTVCRLFN